MKKLNAEKIKPRTERQTEFIRTVNEVDIMLLEGPPGASKTFMSIGIACQWLARGRVEKVIMAQATKGLSDDYGWTSGSYKEKASDYFITQQEYFEDFLGRDTTRQLWESDIIQFTSVGLLRGRNFRNTAVILDEAQRLDKENMLLFVSRFSTNSKMIICGDRNQIQKPCLFGSMMDNIESNKIGKITFGEEEIFRHKDMYHFYKQIEDL